MFPTQGPGEAGFPAQVPALGSGRERSCWDVCYVRLEKQHVFTMDDLQNLDKREEERENIQNSTSLYWLLVFSIT